MNTNDFKRRIVEGEQLFTQGHFEQALRVFEDVLSLDPLNVEAMNDAGLACAALDDPAGAARYFEHALHINAGCEHAFFNLLDLLVRVGDIDLVIEAFVHYEGGIPDNDEKERYRAALFGSGDGFDPEAEVGLPIDIVTPEPVYELLETIHADLCPETYVEIGVGQGASLVLADPDTFVIGIDPKADVQVPLSDRASVFATTSDAFFREHDLAREFDGRPVDLALLDGMRLFEYALRDFMHVERHCTPDSVILVRDAYPADAASASRERKEESWSGDVWKLIPCLKKYRPDLQIHTVDVEPGGLAIITGLDPDSTALSANLEAIYKEYIPMSFDALAIDKEGMLNRVDHDRETVRNLISAREQPITPALQPE